MMTLSQANDLVTPILQSELFKTNKDLQKKVEEIKESFVGFKLTNPLMLAQFEVLDEKKEAAFRELIALYETLSRS